MAQSGYSKTLAAEQARRRRGKPVGKSVQSHRGPQDTTAIRVGFYGCSYLNGVVRVGLPEGEARHPMAYPYSKTLTCPCGREHKVSLTWRKLNEGEELRAEVEVG